MYLDKFVHSSTGKYLMSIILGIGLATIFRGVCKGKRCRTFAAPSSEELDGQIYNFNGNCYRLEKNPIKCAKNKQTLNIA